MTNPFAVNVLGGLNPGDEIRKGQAAGQQKQLFEQKQQDQARLAIDRKKIQSAMKGAIAGDADAIETLFTLNPELGLKMDGRHEKRRVTQGKEADKAKTKAELAWATEYRQALQVGD